MEYVRAFAVGGAICVVGQLLIDLTKLTPARIMVAYVTGGVILGALGWYAPLVNFAGCGATVPLSGFGYLLSENGNSAALAHGSKKEFCLTARIPFSSFSSTRLL